MKSLLLNSFLFLFGFAQLPAQWTEVPNGLEFNLNGVHFVNRDTGFISATSTDSDYTAKIFKTTDGGVTWDTVFHDPTPYSWLEEIEFIGSDHGFVSARLTRMHHTSDGGATWDTAHFDGVGFVYKDLDMANENVGYLTGWGGDIQKTEDGGNTWTEKLRLFPSIPYVLDFIATWSDSVCIAGGASGRLIKTVDGWETWTNIFSAPGFNSVVWVTENKLIGIENSSGSKGTIWNSADGGSTWTILDSGYSAILSEIQLIDGHLFIAGSNASILHSEDLGDTWEVMNFDSLGVVFRDLYMVSPEYGFATGDNGALWRLGSPTPKIEAIQSSFSVYPNPFNEVLQFEWRSYLSEGKLTLTNVMGQVVWQEAVLPISPLRVDLGSLSKGVYFYKLSAGETLIETGKVIKRE